MSRKFRVIRCDRPFSGQTNSFPAVLILQMLSPFINSNFFPKTFGARRAREITSPRKTSIFFECCKKWPQQKNFFAEMWRMAKKIFGLTEIFVNTSSDQNLILCKKKGSTLMSTYKNIAIFHVYAVVRTSIIF